MPDFTQDNRLMKFSSVLGPDVLLIESLEGSEGISRLYEFNAELIAPAGTDVDPKALIGTKASIALALNDVEGTRWFHGIIASFEQGSGDAEMDTYHARLVPSLWQLTLSSDCRVFQNEAVMDIVKDVIEDYGLTLSDETSESYKPLDYCTQYNESDLHFITRILEQHGVAYWFEHSEDDNKIVFGDSHTAYDDCPESSDFDFEPQSGGAEGSTGAGIDDFRSVATMVTGRHASRDYDFRPYAPHDNSAVSSASPFGQNAYEHFIFPAGEEGYVKETGKELTDPEHGGGFLKAEAQAGDAMAEVFHGISNARSLTCGYTWTMDKHPRDAWNQKYLLTEVVHHVRQSPSYRSAENHGSGYTNRFSAISAASVFKPRRTAQKPRIYGPQTALVVAPSGEEMFIDKLGRVCVQFFWDRERQPHTIDNTWVRVGQPWAGRGWGTFFWPRLNDEVIVQFLNGDPDNPVVVGSVYNGSNVPKYSLPDHSTRSGVVTRSSKGGSAANANELRFEDKKGSEQIFLNAEMDMDQRTEKDHRRFVGGKDSLIVKGSQLEQINGNHHITLGGDRNEKIAGDLSQDLTGDRNEKIGGSFSINVTENHAEKAGQNYTMDAGQQVYIKAGMTVVIESGMNLCLKGAGGFITIGPSGIAISGTMVMINSGGAAVPGTAGELTDPTKPVTPDQADDGSKGGKL